MGLSTKDIKHLAKLARLDLTEAEIKKYRREISGIISYIEHIAEINVSKKEATPSLASATALRKDEVRLWAGDERKMSLDAARRKKNRYIAVPRVFKS